MEIVCNRCHQAVQTEDCFCPSCGLPQLVYEADGSSGQTQPERWNDAAQDASVVNWKPALRSAVTLAVPAGLLSSAPSPVGIFGLVWMTAAAAWAVVLYMRSQRPAWITIGAGARIGLVTGLIAAWLAFGISGGGLFVQRFVLHQSGQIDAEYKTVLDAFQQKTQQSIAGMGTADATQVQAEMAQVQAWMASAEGHAGILACAYAGNSLFLLCFAIAGGALGARLLARSRRPEI